MEWLFKWLGWQIDLNLGVEFEEREKLNSLLEQLAGHPWGDGKSRPDATDIVSVFFRLTDCVYLVEDFLYSDLTYEDWEDLETILFFLHGNLLFRRAGRINKSQKEHNIALDAELTEAAEQKIEAVKRVLDPVRYRIGKDVIEQFLSTHTENPLITRGKQIDGLIKLLDMSVVEIVREGDRISENVVKVRNEVIPALKPLREIAAAHCKRPKLLRNLAIDIYPEVFKQVVDNKVDRRTGEKAWEFYKNFSWEKERKSKHWQPRSKKRRGS